MVVLHSEDGVTVSAEREVLAANSLYFRSMFKQGFSEGDASDVTIKGIRGEPLKLLVDYCSTDKLLLNDDNVLDLYTTAIFLQIGESMSYTFYSFTFNLTF